MASRLPVYSWDANVFIAWLEGEEPHLQGIAAVLDDIENDKAGLVVPSIVYCEVLEFHRTKKDRHQFTNFMLRSNVQPMDVTVRMAERAEEIRSKGMAARPRRAISTPDALYIATAIMGTAHALHTTEKNLISLSKTPIVDGLEITAPRHKTGRVSMFP